MKKPARMGRKAMIERGKTVAIVLLCVCCLYFLYSIWELYKGQVSIGKAFWGTENSKISAEVKSENVVNSFRELTEPDLIMVGQASARAILQRDDEGYADAVDSINGVMKNVYTQPSTAFEKTDRNIWQTIISNGIIYVKYPCSVMTSFEKPFATSDESTLTGIVKMYSDVIIVPSATADTGVTVFIRDENSKQDFKVELNLSSKELRSIISDCKDKRDNAYVFAHELNLDTPRTDESGKSAVMLDSMFLIHLEKISANNIVTRVPETYKTGLSFGQTGDFVTNLINAFGYNPNTVRQYANSDGALIFVGDTGSLSLHPDGKIEYKALGESEGIPLTGEGGSTVDSRGIMSGIVGMTDTIFSVCGVNEQTGIAKLRITEMPDMSNVSDVRVKMDYFADNCQVLLGTQPAVDAVIKNGSLVELRVLVKTVEKTDKRTPCEDAFRAIDGFCEENPQCKSITDGSLVYKAFEDEKETSAVWRIQGE